jgi:hypothetical protein
MTVALTLDPSSISHTAVHSPKQASVLEQMVTEPAVCCMKQGCPAYDEKSEQFPSSLGPTRYDPQKCLKARLSVASDVQSDN